MTHQPNNVSAAGVLTDEQIKTALTKEGIGFYAHGGILGNAENLIAAIRRLLAAASAQATAQIGWFVQRSSFGPWIEVERYEDGAVRLHRMDGDQATGQAVAWQVRRADGRIDAAPIQWENCTKELYDATLQTGRYAGYENGPRCEVRALTVAAPSPAAREAGDGVTLTAVQRIAIEAAISISADIEAECHDGSFLSDASVQALRALLREAGSR